MSWNVMEIARYILGYFSKMGTPISNLQLQKLLYFCWIDYYQAEKKYLFDEPFIAWRLGPIVKSVYYEYCSNGGFPIFASESNLPDGINRKIIDECLDKHRDWSGYRMVEKSHHSGGAWDRIYHERGSGTKIPPDLIIELECGSNYV